MVQWRYELIRREMPVGMVRLTQKAWEACLVEREAYHACLWVLVCVTSDGLAASILKWLVSTPD